MRETVQDCTREPGRFRNKITNEIVTAMQWRKWNHYHITAWLSDDTDVCTFEWNAYGDMFVYCSDGMLYLRPTDWVLKTDTGIVPCATKIFDQICEELL